MGARIHWATHGTGPVSLLCLPHAGGDGGVYRTWSRRLTNTARVGVAELPGRGDYFRLPALRRITEQVEWLVPQVRTIAPPLAIFGYSMGALTAYELAHALRDSGARAPALLMLAAHAPPGRSGRTAVLHTLPDDEFVRRIVEFDGMPAEVLENAELLQLIVPRLRADFEACETHAPVQREPLDVPLVVYGGVADREVPHPLLLHWATLSRARCRCVLLPGQHFFLQTAFQILIGDVASRLRSVAREC